VRARPLLPAFLTALLTALAALAAPAAHADAGSESAFISDTNSARANHGLRAYAVAGDLTSAARQWAQWMAAHHTLEHNPSFGSNVCCWSDLGENVGRGSSESQIQSAFMSSSEHRANILSSSYTQIGVGTAWSSDHQLYVDEIFRRPTGTTGSSGSSGSSAPQPVSRPAPARASRSGFRQPVTPRAVTPPRVALGHRLAIARRSARRAERADAVAQAFAYLTAMRTVTR
jgi:hypothetical protein